MQRFDDPLLRELVKDMCLDRSLRHDVFVRGARRMNPAVRDAALMDVRLALNISPEEMPFEADMPAGRAALNRAFYGPIAEALAAGPRRVGDLLELPNLEGQRDNPGGADRHPGGARFRRTGGAAGRRTGASGAAIQPRHQRRT